MDTDAVRVAVQWTISISVHRGTVANRMFAIAVGHFWCISCIAANRNVALLVAFRSGRWTINIAKQTIVRIVMRASSRFAYERKSN